MHTHDRHGVRFLRKEGCEMDLIFMTIVFDGGFVVWEGVDFGFACTPGKTNNSVSIEKRLEQVIRI